MQPSYAQYNRGPCIGLCCGYRDGLDLSTSNNAKSLPLRLMVIQVNKVKLGCSTLVNSVCWRQTASAWLCIKKDEYLNTSCLYRCMSQSALFTSYPNKMWEMYVQSQEYVSTACDSNLHIERSKKSRSLSSMPVGWVCLAGSLCTCHSNTCWSNSFFFFARIPLTGSFQFCIHLRMPQWDEEQSSFL